MSKKSEYNRTYLEKLKLEDPQKYEEYLEKNRKYCNEYRKKNKQYFKKYYEEHKNEIKEYHIDYYSKNKDEINRQKKVKLLENPDLKIRQKKAIKKWVKNNYEKWKKYNTEYQNMKYKTDIFHWFAQNAKNCLFAESRQIEKGLMTRKRYDSVNKYNFSREEFAKLIAKKGENDSINHVIPIKPFSEFLKSLKFSVDEWFFYVNAIENLEIIPIKKNKKKWCFISDKSLAVASLLETRYPELLGLTEFLKTYNDKFLA